MKKKYLLNLLFLLSLFLIPNINVQAATGKIDLYVSSKNVTIGSSVTVSVYCESSVTIGTCEYTIDYDSKKLKLTSVSDQASCNPSGYCMYAVGSKKSSAKKFTFKVLTTGTHKVSAKSATMYELNHSEEDVLIKTSVDPTTFTSTTASSTNSSGNNSSSNSSQTTYSTNNNLKNLTVDNVPLSPKFNKNTTEYKATIDSNISSIKINATKEDNKAKIKGTGTFPVTYGDNKFPIVVTSEKGTTKTYNITITVEDKNPIPITINEKNYNIIKSASILTKPNNYTETKVTINDQEIPAFYNELLDYTIIGIKDVSGKINYAIYEQPNTYRLYKEIQFDATTLEIDETKTLSGYNKIDLEINDNNIHAYQKDESSHYAFFYGTNLATGKSGWYSYDKEENTIQKNYEDDLSLQDTKIEQAKKIIITLVLACILLVIILIIVSIMKMKNNHQKTKEQQKHYEELKEKKKNNNPSNKKPEKQTKEPKELLEEITKKENEEQQKLKKKKPEDILDEW